MAPKRSFTVSGLLLCSLLSQVARAAGVPQQMSYAGRLTDGAGIGLDRIVQIRFGIFDAPAAGTALWSDNQSVGIVNGLYSVVLGSAAENPLPERLFDGRRLYLELAIDGATLSPRQSIVSVPYALKAGIANALGNLASVGDGAVRVAAPAAAQGTGTVGCTDAASADLIGAGTAFSGQAHVGDQIVANNITRTIFGIASDTRLTVDRPWGATFTGVSFTLQRPAVRVGASDGPYGLVITPQGHFGKLPSKGAGLLSDGAIYVNEGWVGGPQELAINSNQIWKSVTTGDPNLYLQYSNPNGAVVIGGQEGANNDLHVHGGLYVKTGTISSGTRAGFALVLQGDRNMVLYENGRALWGSGTEVSDIRLKRDIVPLGPVLPQLAEMKAIRFKYDGPMRSDEPHLGLIAQEVERAFPELVYTDKGGNKLVYYDKISAVLVQAVKELSKADEEHRKSTAALESHLRQKDRALDELRAENVSLHARLDRMESMLKRLAVSSDNLGRTRFATAP
jgi:hypothetical protein